MSLLPLALQPGLYTESSARTALGRFKDGSNVRFFKGNAEKVGGWEKLIQSSFNGVCRAIRSWTTLSFSRYAALGTNNALYLTDLTSFFDITPIRASGTLTNPYTTTMGQSVVSVAHTGHGLSVNDVANLSGGTPVGGLTIAGAYPAQTVPDVNHYTIQAGSAATSGAIGGGTVTYSYEIPVGNVDSIFGTGWGMGGWGIGTWGTARVAGFLQGLCRIWSLANWGEDLIASPIDNPIYVWIASNGVNTRAVLITNAPARNRRILVSTQLRILISLGSHDGTEADPMLIRWCDSEDYTDWTPDITNLAGDKRLDNGNEIVGALLSRAEIVVITDTTLYSMTLTGDDLVFAFADMGQTSGLAGPNAAADVDGTVYAMGRGTFYTYNGQVSILECDVFSRVFGTPEAPGINYTQAAKIFCARNKLKTELIWFFCSAQSTEIDSCVGLNYDDKSWWLGDVARTCWTDTTPFTDQFNTPIAAGTDGVNSTLYLQETGVDADGEPLPYFAETYDLEISQQNNLITGVITGAGQTVYRVKRLFPDFQRLAGSHTATLKGRKYPNGKQRIKGPINFGDQTTHIDGHIRARQIALRIESDELGADISVGQWRADISQEGGRVSPRITNVPDQYDAASWRNIMRDLDARFGALEKAVSSYAVTNFTVSRSLNMSGATATDIGNFLCTLVQDLQMARNLAAVMFHKQGLTRYDQEETAAP